MSDSLITWDKLSQVTGLHNRDLKAIAAAGFFADEKRLNIDPTLLGIVKGLSAQIDGYKAREMESPKFTITRASAEWNLQRETLLKRFMNLDIKPEDGRYSIRQIDAAVHGDKDDEDLALVRAKREAQEMANEKEAGNLVDLAEYRQHVAKKVITMKQEIMSFAWLTDAQKDLILTTFSRAYSVEHPDSERK